MADETLLRSLAQLFRVLADLLEGATPSRPQQPVASNGQPTRAAPDPGLSAARHHKDRLLATLQVIPRPLKAEALAHRSELPYSSYIRKLLGEMVRDGEVIHAPKGGYWPARRPLPVG